MASVAVRRRTAPFLRRSHLHSACGSSRSLASGSVSPPPPRALPPPSDLARCKSWTLGLAGGVAPERLSDAVRSLLEESPRRLPLLLLPPLLRRCKEEV